MLASLSAVTLMGAIGLWLWCDRRPPPARQALSPRPVLDSHERMFLRRLREALPQYVVLPRLPLARLCQPVNPRATRRWQRRLRGLEVDFAICTPNGRVVATLDVDAEHRGSARSRQLKQEVLGGCGIRQLDSPAHRLPSVAELQQVVSATMRPLAADPAAAGLRLAATPAGVAPPDTEPPSDEPDLGVFKVSFFDQERHDEAARSSGWAALGTGAWRRARGLPEVAAHPAGS